MRLHPSSLWLISLLATGMVSLAGCGTEQEDVEDEPDTDVSTEDVGGDTPDPPPDVDPDVPGDACTADRCGEPDAPTTCSTPDPRGCLALGCPEGQTCAFANDECTPSACSCDPATDSWQCTADCGPTHQCIPEGEPTCPDTPPFGGSCDPALRDTTCSWGSESCCGQRHPSEECQCEGGRWVCWATDACFIESCEGRPCERDVNCEGGGRQTVCIEGTCQSPRSGSCADATSRDTCNATDACHWRDPGCADDAELVPAGCYPAIDCSTALTCPDGYTCRDEVAVLPDCAYPDPDGTSCDACAMTIALCVPQ